MLKRALRFSSATFQFTILNLEQLYLLRFGVTLSEHNLYGNLRKLAFPLLTLVAIWSYRLAKRYSMRRLGQFPQHLKNGCN